MANFLDLFGFLAVLLRAATLALGSIAIGGVIFAFLISGRRSLADAQRRLLITSAAILALVQSFGLLANSLLLQETTKLPLRALVGATFFVYGSISLLAAATLSYLAFRRRDGTWLSLACATILLITEVATSHSAARLTDQALLLSVTAVHQAATAAWIGGLPYLFLGLLEKASSDKLLQVARRFSRLSLWSVALLFGAGTVLSLYYIGSPAAIYGTNYGLMVLAKVILFLLVIALGGVNFRVISTLKSGDTSWSTRVARIGEAEIGIGITVVLAAASLTSQPPGIDLKADRVPASIIMARLTPKLPRLQTPPISSLSPSSRQQWKATHPPSTSGNESYIPGQVYVPSTPGDIAWSEYNHHWAGLIVFSIGVLAVLCRVPKFGWARHWPLAFTGLAAFLLLRADPDSWPLGPDGFWESFAASEVTQHRVFVLLILLFAVFEWGIQTRRLTSGTAALVFPGVCATGGALLLTHTHALSNIQQELLAELSHLPLALLAVVAGWTRWLELRYPGPRRKWAAHVWPVCFALIGVVLLLYREG